MKMFHSGSWLESNESIDVYNPFDGSLIDTVPAAQESDISAAIEYLVTGSQTMATMPVWKRCEILSRAADLVRQNEKRLAELITREEGKPIRESRAEVRRSATTLQLSAEAARNMKSEVIPLDTTVGGENKLGFTLRVPCGIVAAITPFNFPLNLVCHKIGPAIGGGNATLIKPATDTPLSALALTELLLEAGLPENAIACVTGSGSRLGKAVCGDSRIRKISFTGSVEVGKQICAMAGLKRVTMELGSNSPLIVLPDADLDKVAKVVATNGFANAGQVCISAQRLITVPEIHDELMQNVCDRVAKIESGNPLDKKTQLGPMVRESDAIRVESWIADAISSGAEIVTGGKRVDAMVSPTIIDNATSKMKIVNDELFGPAVAAIRADNVDDAIRMANDSRFGLSAGVFTRDIDAAIQCAKEIDSGNIHINWGPMWRADGMPYGGLRESGIGKEGPEYAIREMTETKMIVLHS